MMAKYNSRIAFNPTREKQNFINSSHCQFNINPFATAKAISTMVIFVWITLVLAVPASAGTFLGLTPGSSSMEDVVRVLGPPIKETILGISYDFAPEKFDARRISVSFNVSTAFVELIDLHFLKPMGKQEVIRYFDLKEPALSYTTDRGTLIEFYAPANVALHYDGPDDSHPVVFFSHFDPAIFDKKSQASGAGMEGSTIDAKDAADRYFEMGLEASDREDYASAIGYLERAIELNPGPPYYHVLLGITLFESGRPDPAIRAFEKAISIEPGYDSYYGLGMCYFEKRDFPRAASALEKGRNFWQAETGDYSLIELLALCYLQQRQYKKALDEFRYLHKKVYDKKEPRIIYQMALCYDALGQKKNARIFYDWYLDSGYGNLQWDETARRRLSDLRKGMLFPDATIEQFVDYVMEGLGY